MKDPRHKLVLSRYTPTHISKTIEPLILPPRLARIDGVLNTRLSSIHLVFECPSDVHNALAAVRSAEAFGLVHVHIINPDNQALYTKTITQSSVYWINLHYHKSLEDFLSSLPNAPHVLAGAVMDAPEPVESLPHPTPLYLIFGNEHRGLSASARHACHQQFRIPMHGMSESLNLSVSASIAAYVTTQKRREVLEHASDLTGLEREQLQAKYYLNSLSPQFLDKLFPLP